MALGYLHGLFESIPGNETNSPTPSTKVIYFPLITARPSLGADHMERDDENRNQDQPLPVLPEAYDPSWEYESRAYPDLLGFWLKAMLGAPTTTAGNGVITDPDTVAIPAGAHRHVWTAPFGPAGASPQTSQLQFSYVDQAVYYKLKGAAVESLTIESPVKGGARVACSGPAAYMTRQANPSLTPTYESLALRPFTRGNLTLATWLSGTGTHEDFSINIANPIEMVRSLGIASRFPDVVEKGEGLIVVSGSVPKRQLDPDDWDALLNATGFSAKVKWINDSIIASAYPYKLFIEMSNCQYVAGDADELSNQRRIGGTFDFKATYSGSASVTITLVNATTSYA